MGRHLDSEGQAVTEQARARYKAAMHAVQSGVATKMQIDPAETSAKHLRVGVNAAMVEHAALMQLLFDKGVITVDEYEDTLVRWAEREAEMYRQWLQAQYPGSNITLA